MQRFLAPIFQRQLHRYFLKQKSTIQTNGFSTRISDGNKKAFPKLGYGSVFLAGSVLGALSGWYLWSQKNIDSLQIHPMAMKDTSELKLGGFEGDYATGSAQTGTMSRYAIADAVAKVAPAVVNITVTVEGSPSPWLGSLSPREVQQSSGSGFIFDPQGFILTNAHVVSEAFHYTGQLTVTLQDGRAFPGKIHSHDNLSDLAVIKIDAGQPLPCASMGSSHSLRPGEWVIALGSPLMLANSVTAGIVSAVQRESYELGFPGSSKLAFIQTDAAINVGNSGGPLVNLDGEVVGINTMKALRSDGISFALPIDLVKEVVDQLKNHGFVKRPYLGIKLLTLSPRVLEELKQRDPHFPTSVTYGVLVPQVLPGSPADRGGLRPGDVIIEFDEKPVKSTREFLDILGYRVEKPIRITIIRGEEGEKGVQGVFPIEPYFVREQLESVFSDISVVGVKTGMLYDSAIIHQVVEVLKRYPSVPLVVDPVLVAKGGHRLLNEEALETLKSELFPLAALITPNIPEASVLVKRSLESLGQVREAAYELQRTGCRAVLVKGGHTIASSELQDACIDILVDEQGLEVYGKPRMDTLNTHGTGCTTAAAITAQLAKGISLREAIAVTKSMFMVV
eukprot:jgi/Galph1/1981/GphlegSOOS_G642.1